MPWAVLSWLLIACTPVEVAGPDGGGSGGPTDSGTGSGDGGDGGFGGDGGDGGDGGIEDIELGALVFDPEHGLAAAAFELSLHTDLSDAEIWFTQDHSDPTVADNPAVQVYSGPIALSETAVVRAVLVRDGQALTPVETRTWVFPAQVPDQERPSDWPEAWWTQYGSAGFNAPLYTLSPDVVAADRAGVEAALAALPTVSLVLADEDLFGAQGIYENPEEVGADWERAGAVELLPFADDAGFALGAGVRIHGGASRLPQKSPKKSFRLLFKAAYGPARLEYPLFSADPDGADVRAFDTLVLRARFNRSWIHWSPEQRAGAQNARDQYGRDSHRVLGARSPRGRHVHLYLNGMYWGIYNLGERPDAHFMAAWYGGAAEDWDVINTTEAIDGTDDTWQALMAQTAQGAQTEPLYQALQAQIDGPEFIDYMLVQMWLGNQDWPHNNWYASKNRAEDGPWRFFMWDVERVLEELDVDRTQVSDANGAGVLYDTLRQHPDFEAELSARADELLAEQGPLGPAAAIERYQALTDTLAPAIIAESARWGHYRRDVYCWASTPCELYTVEGFWAPERDRILSEYLPERAQQVREQFAQQGL